MATVTRADLVERILHVLEEVKNLQDPDADLGEVDGQQWEYAKFDESGSVTRVRLNRAVINGAVAVSVAAAQAKL